MDLNFKSNMQSRSQISSNNDLEDSFVEVFRSRQNSNSVSQNGEQIRAESISLTQKHKSVSNVNVVQKDELGRLNENESTSKLNEICNLLKDNIIQHCPICFKKNTCDQISGFIAHLKGCASKHKISTEQLIKAVQLVEKQASERIALGLPKITSERIPARKSYTKQVGMDSNMQLAMALSASLRESEFLTRLKETETLIEAGLEQEVIMSCKQLEDFGFKTSKQCDIRPPKTNSRSKNRNTILFFRSQAERERIITEKVAIILIDSDEQHSDSLLPASSCYFELKSKFLRSIRDKNSEVWKKSFQSNEEASDRCYYLENLSSFISPRKVEVGAKLRHISQIPGRMSSDESHFSRSLQELTDFFRPSNKDPPKSTTKMTSNPVVQKSKISRLSADYKSLVNKKLMSDITIYAKNERSVYAHKLVFYARCGAILDDSIKETENGKTSEIIMWMEFCYESVIAFLEYVYADASDSVYQLDEKQLSDLNELCARYHVNDLKARVDELTLKEPFTSTILPAKENFDTRLGRSAGTSNRANETSNSIYFPSPASGEQNLEFLQMALATQNEQRSPEIFVDSDTPLEENDFSLSIHDSSPTATCSSGDTPINSGNAMKKCETSLAELSQKSRVAVVGEKTPQWTCDTDVICLSDDDDCIGTQDLHQNTPQDVDQMKLNGVKSDKRKSASPLLMSPAKKPILMKGSPPKNSVSKNRVRRKQRIKTSSQYTLSDSFESSDSDESLYKIKANSCEPTPGCSFFANLSQTSSKPLTHEHNRLTSTDTSFELDDFRNLVPESRNSNGCEVGESCDSKLPNEGVISGAEVEAPYISPIWDGFDDYQDHYLDTNFSSPVAPLSKFSTPVKNLLTKSLVSPISSRTFRRSSSKADESPGNKNCVSGTPDVPTFESFSIDESVLSKLERKSNVSKPGASTQVATPSNVRMLKARSKSDTFLTPSPRGNGCVTPMANYSSMKTVELKRELDKYGLKPGMGKTKAKKLLRHIYEQLHPLEEETIPKHQPEEKQKPARKKKTSKNSVHSDNVDRKLAAISVDTDESSDSFASGIEELEASFADDVQNLDNIDDSKSQRVSIDVGFKNLLREDKELHTQILLYEPIWLDQVKIKLKENNIKCSTLTLMNYLDEKCITFRTRNQRRVRHKRKKIKSIEAQAT